MSDQPTFLRLKPLQFHLTLALASLPMGGAVLYSPAAAAATCAAASSASNTVSASCEDLSWTNGDLTINTNAVISRTNAVLNAITASGTLGNLNLTAGSSISSSNRGIRVMSNSSIGVMTIGGPISALESGIELVFNGSGQTTTVGTITNSGNLVSQSSNAISVGSGVTVSTINNLQGTLSGFNDPNDYAGISNQGTIGTLNNGQMGLTYRRTAPGSYNIYITSTSNYGTMIVRGTSNFGIGAMNFGVASGSTIQNNHLYTGVIQASGTTTFDSTTSKTGTFTSGGSSYSYTLQWNSTTSVWDLLFGTLITGPSSADTQASLQGAASALRDVYKVQLNVINASLDHDCTEFADKQICISGGGRFAISDNFSGEKFSTLLVAAYQTKDKLRIGAFIDQNAFRATAEGVELSKSPMYGIFGVWKQKPEGHGLAVRLAASYADHGLNQTRSVSGTSEAGTGKSTLTSQAFSAEVNYAHAFPQSDWIGQPYLGVRTSSIQRSGYTENSSITSPLTFSSVKQTHTTALAGVRVTKQNANGLQFNGHLGIEQELNSRSDKLKATGITGLTDTLFSGNAARTRPTASLGASYAIAKNQRINLSMLYRAEALKSSSNTTGTLTYQIGL